MSDAPPTTQRPFRMATFLGAPASGKTTLIEMLLWRYRREVPENPTYVLDPNAAFPDDPGAVWPEDGDAELWLSRLKDARAKQGTPPGLLLLDDADRYLSGGAPRGVWKDLFTSFRHWRLDVFLNARRTQDIPKMAIQSADTCYIFRQREVHGREYLAKQLGEEILPHIPTAPFEYLRVDVDSGELLRGVTRARRTRTVSDR